MSNDIDELTALNRDYVASVQNSDVKRFDEILARGFLLLQSRQVAGRPRAFLKQTAVPVTIKNLHGARREDPRARRLRHHPRRHQLSRTPDGQQAHGRYTDCWAKQNGKWLAVSAHVSR